MNKTDIVDEQFNKVVASYIVALGELMLINGVTLGEAVRDKKYRPEIVSGMMSNGIDGLVAEHYVLDKQKYRKLRKAIFKKKVSKKSSKFGKKHFI